MGLGRSTGSRAHFPLCYQSASCGCNPVPIYLGASSIELRGIYLREDLYRIVALARSTFAWSFLVWLSLSPSSPPSKVLDPLSSVWGSVAHQPIFSCWQQPSEPKDQAVSWHLPLMHVARCHKEALLFLAASHPCQAQ